MCASEGVTAGTGCGSVAREQAIHETLIQNQNSIGTY